MMEVEKVKLEKTESEIKRLLPHRRPFIFLDRLDMADEKNIAGRYRFTDSDEFFAGHFPGYPVVPGVLLVEMMAQCGGAGVKKAGIVDTDKLFFLASVEKAKFRKQVRPGDEVIIKIENVRVSARMIRQRGVVTVGDEVAAEAAWMCLVGE